MPTWHSAAAGNPVPWYDPKRSRSFLAVPQPPQDVAWCFRLSLHCAVCLVEWGILGSEIHIKHQDSTHSAPSSLSRSRALS